MRKEFFKNRKKLSISIILVFIVCLQSCGNEIIGQYVGIDETRGDEIILNLNGDYSFKMSLFLDGNFENTPQETLVGVWEKKENQLRLITKDNKIIYEQIFENLVIEKKSFTQETYIFKSCEKDCFASNFNFCKDN